MAEKRKLGTDANALALRRVFCLPLQLAPLINKSIMSSMSFDKLVEDFESLLQVIRTYATELAAKMRPERLSCTYVPASAIVEARDLTVRDILFGLNDLEQNGQQNMQQGPATTQISTPNMLPDTSQSAPCLLQTPAQQAFLIQDVMRLGSHWPITLIADIYYLDLVTCKIRLIQDW